MANVAIIDSGGANLASLDFALRRLGASTIVSSDASAIAAAERVLLPGVGSANNAMQRLHQTGLAQAIAALKQPVMGICLGMQLLFEHSAEGSQACLGIIPGSIDRIPNRPGLPVPHMGWNQIEITTNDPLLRGLQSGDYLYFVHSFAATPSPHTLAATRYGDRFSAVVRNRNFWGTQFHPERSSAAGARILANFLELA
jgi:imidazole glycerol-phosphate synthase subunit HisH